MSDDIKLNAIQRAIGAVVPGYRNAVVESKAREALTREYINSARRASRTGRTDKTGYTQQPWGIWGNRTMTAAGRQIAVKKSRAIYENNVLGRSMLDRAVDNIIGEGMYVRPRTSDDGFNAEADAWWKQYHADDRGMVDNATLQRQWFRSFKRDGDVGGILLKGGQVQTIESDLIQSPDGSIGDQYWRGNRPEVVDGVKLTMSGRPTAFHVATLDAKGKASWPAIPARNFLFIADNDRSDYTAVRGVPTLATIGWLLEQIDGTVEAVVMAHRMSAAFGLVKKVASPGKRIGNLPTTTNGSGNSQAKISIEPGMFDFIGHDDDLIQVKPEHPTTSFSDFMGTLVRFAGLNLGLPLELAMLDFSKTNYSSARASMEQAYRSFRVQQRYFANNWLSKWYRWRIAKAVNLGELSGAIPDDYLNHEWFGQPWPYLNPVDDAAGTLALIDSGRTTLTQELAKVGMTLEDWLDEKATEINKAGEAGVPLVHSNLSRDAVVNNEQTQLPGRGEQQTPAA